MAQADKCAGTLEKQILAEVVGSEVPIKRMSNPFELFLPGTM